ncbi:Ras guanyl-releasing protein 3 [Neolecta irregularis DAH-3]|uniref:Ras guanyl-releasing protein 3 n=1 Tax=Neolecta irregularis (strain DAH-3) TaxID=1198029 RepID=A0A1U7LNC6_NEOID|nr:Ras guanyl-releasing protein 3 [Neolecta irregularis DAH-3]|eukprot:OLL24128.1 Ras guanyl-releasing protein 3 [Neolecta irregularis DAH-3]
MGFDSLLPFMSGRLKKPNKTILPDARFSRNVKHKSLSSNRQLNKGCLDPKPLISDLPPPVHPSVALSHSPFPISDFALRLGRRYSNAATNRSSRTLPAAERQFRSKTVVRKRQMTTAQASLPPLSDFDSFAHTIADDLSSKGYKVFARSRLHSSVQSSQASTAELEDYSLEYSADQDQSRIARSSHTTGLTTPPSTGNTCKSSSLGSIRRNTKQLAIDIALPCRTSPCPHSLTRPHAAVEDFHNSSISRFFLRKTPKKRRSMCSDNLEVLSFDNVSVQSGRPKNAPPRIGGSESFLRSPCSEHELRSNFNRPAILSPKSPFKQSTLPSRHIDFQESSALSNTNEVSAFDSDSDDETSSMKLRRSLRRGKTTNLFADVLSRFRSGHPSPSIKDEAVVIAPEEKGVWKAINDQGRCVYIVFKCEERKLIIAGILQYLANQMIITLDDSFVEQMILSHQLFTTTEDLLGLLFLELRNKGSQNTTRRRILNIIKLWLIILPSSLFLSLKLIRAFIREACNSGFIDEARRVARMLAAYSTRIAREDIMSRQVSERDVSITTFMELDIGELARYFARVDISIYCAVVDQSVICEYWASGEGRMAEALRRTKIIGHWVEREVFESDNSAKVMCRFIELAQILLSRSDFQTAGTIIHGLSRTSLQDITHNIPLPAYESLEHLKGVFTFEPLYRSALSFASGSIIHYLPFLLRDLESFRDSEHHLDLQKCSVKYTSFAVSKDAELIHFDKYRQLLEEIRGYMIDGPLIDISPDSAVVSNWPKLFPNASVGIADAIGDQIERFIGKV